MFPWKPTSKVFVCVSSVLIIIYSNNCNKKICFLENKVVWEPKDLTLISEPGQMIQLSKKTTTIPITNCLLYVVPFLFHVSVLSLSLFHQIPSWMTRRSGPRFSLTMTCKVTVLPVLTKKTRRGRREPSNTLGLMITLPLLSPVGNHLF